MLFSGESAPNMAENRNLEQQRNSDQSRAFACDRKLSHSYMILGRIEDTLESKQPEKQQSKGEMAATLPPQSRFQAVGLANIHARNWRLMRVVRVVGLNQDTCPILHRHLSDV